MHALCVVQVWWARREDGRGLMRGWGKGSGRSEGWEGVVDDWKRGGTRKVKGSVE